MASISNDVQQLHNSLLMDLSDMMDPSDSTYKNFIRCLVCDTLPLGRLSRVKQDPIDVFNLMEERGVLGVGKYQDLEKALEISQYIVVLDHLKKAKEGITEQMMKSRFSDDTDKSYNIEPVTVSSIKPEDISKLRDDLITAYKNLRCIQVSPIYEKERCKIDDIYVDLVIEEKQDSRNKKEESKYDTTQRKVVKVTSYKQIFLDERGSSFKRVYLRGKGGLGKTTFCRKILHAWCNAHEGKAVAQDGSFQDEAVLKLFDLLFYINLREVSVEQKTLIAVIHAQFPLEEVPSENILKNHLKLIGDKVLFILDGLDEMIVKAEFIDNVVNRRLYPNCCFLVSSRPWKISKMKLQDYTEIDLLLDLEGFSKQNAIEWAKNIFEKYYNDGNAIKQFEKDIECNKLATQLIHIPLLLLFMVHVWYENERSLPSKLNELFILFLNLMVDRMKKKYKKDPNLKKMRFTLDGTLSPFPHKISKMSLVLIFGEGFLLSLCKVAHHFLLCSEKENSLVFEKTKLKKVLGNSGKEKLDVALDLGILSVSDSVSCLTKKISVSFLHKTMQEFLTAVYLILNPEKLEHFISSISDLNDVQQNDNIIVFLVGLMPGLVNTVLEKVNELCMADWDMQRRGKELLSGVELEMGMLAIREQQIMNRNRLPDISKIYLRCKEEVTGEDVLLNVSCLYLEPSDFDPHPWNPASLKVLYLMHSQFKYVMDFMLIDLRGLTGLTYLKLNRVRCDLKLPESGSLSVLIVDSVKLSSSCCDVLDERLSHCTKLKSLTIFMTNLQKGLLDLTKMTELIDLDMFEVSMSSSCCDMLGSTLTHCTKLQKLKIHNTDLRNCLLDLSNMTDLQKLDMSTVMLSSSCCDALGSTLTHCTKLKKLKIYNTDLHNHVLDLSNMTELRDLDMANVTLSSSCCDALGTTLTHCTKLKSLSICFSDLYDCVLDLSSMTELRNLDVADLTLSSSSCEILGTTLTKCTKLENLKIHYIDLDTCLLDFSKMTKLTELDMLEVTLSTECCDVLGRSLTHCTKLELLSMSNIDLHNCLLDFTNMTELTVLNVSGITLSSSCCDVLGRTLTNCTKLKKLKIHKTDLNNCVLDISNMTELAHLDMSGVTISSSCYDVLGRTLTHCTKLNILRISNTDLNNCVLDISNNSELTDLHMSKVTLSVSCCDALGSTLTCCTKLKNISISNTDLHNFVFDPSCMPRSCNVVLDGVSLSNNADKQNL